MKKICSIEGCGKPHSARGWCVRHYDLWRRRGDTNAPPKKRADGSGSFVGGYFFTTKNGIKKQEHIRIAEQALGKPLPKGAQVHHCNENKADNRPENLVIGPDRAYHALLHQRMRALDACGHAGWRKCKFCKKYDDPVNLYISKANIYHAKCVTAYQRERHTAKLKGIK